MNKDRITIKLDMVERFSQNIDNGHFHKKIHDINCYWLHGFLIIDRIQKHWFTQNIP